MSRILALAVLVATSVLSHADDRFGPPRPGPETASPPVAIAALIAQLERADFRARELATRALTLRSGEALPLLRDALTKAAPEARLRLESIIKQVEQQAMLAPRLVTLRAVDRPVSDLIADISRQTGYKLQGGAEGVRLTMDLVDVPFWEAIDKLCFAAGLMPNHNDNEGSLYLNQQDAYVPYRHYAGPFRVCATGFHINRNSNFAQVPRNPAQNQNQHNEHFQFSFSVASEPRLPILALGQAKVTQAEDDRGRSLLLPNNNHVHNTYYYGGHRSLMQHGGAQLLPPDRDADSVRLIRGTIPVTVLLEQRPAITLNNILKGGKQSGSFGSITLEVFKINQQNGNQYAVELALKNDNNKPLDPSFNGSLYQRIELQDDKGQAYQPHGANENRSPNSVSGTFHYGHNGRRNLGKPARLIYHHWNTAQHTIAFEFRDLPLP